MRARDEGTPSLHVQLTTLKPQLAHLGDGQLTTSQGSLLHERARLLALSPTSGQAEAYLPVDPSPPPHWFCLKSQDTNGRQMHLG